MKTKINEAIRQVLQQFGEKYFIEEVLNKNKVIQDLDNYDTDLLEAFISNETLKRNFTIDVAGNIVMQTNKLIELFEVDEYWQDSYTKYSKKIGLTAGGKFIDESMDVVLDFPYKDTVLKASMSKEDTDKGDLRPNEPFLNEVIAKEEIDVLLDKKILVNVKKYDKNGEHEVDSFSKEDNLVMKGNNLLALHTLKEKYAGKVKLIYIDPPYNTGGDSFIYNDHFNHSTWLTFMKNRLEIAREFLQVDGTIAISIDHNEIGYLLVLLDGIIGKQNRKNIITVKRGSVTGAKVINPGVVNITEYVVIYSNDTNFWRPNRVYMENANGWDKRYNQFIKNYDMGIENWKFSTVLEEFARSRGIEKSKLKKELGDDYEGLLSDFVYKNSERIIQLATLDENSISKKAISLKKESLKQPNKVFYMEREGKRPYYIVKGKLILFIKHRMVNIDGKDTFAQPATDIWDDVLPNDIHNEGGVVLRKGKKPEKLISRIIELCTDEKDIVMDFFVGSGTTAAVSLKKNRQFIAIEQMNYIDELTNKRLLNTIKGEQSGISNRRDWQGGGSFVYVELMEKNREFLKSIRDARTQTELHDIFDFLLKEAEIDFRVDLEVVKEMLHELSFDDQKKTLIKIIDKNQLYYNYSEIDDENVRDLISNSNYAFNKNFYDEGGE